jgi:PAS domain S-box-containing protein
MTLGLHEADQLAALLAAAFAAHTRAAADARALFVNSPIGIVMVDAGGTVREANDAFLRMTRRPLDDITSGDLRWDSVVPVEWHARNAAAIATTLLGTRPEPIEQECSRPDGTRVPVLVSFGPTQHDAGLVAIFVVNLTDRRAAEATLRQMVAQQRLFIDKAPVGIAIFDREMRYLAASRRFIQDRRLPIDDPSDLIGWSHYDVMPEMPPAWRDVHRRVLAGETLAAEEYAFTDAEGRTEWLRWEMTPWPRPDGTIGGALLFSEQITERKQTALALRQSEAQLQHLAKMEAIGNLTGGMAHDFNNLLGVIIGNLDLAQPLVADIPQAHELIGDALAGALRGADLTQRLLAFARRQPLHPQRVAINPLIRRMVRLFARLLGEDIQIMLELTDDTWPVVADAAQIESALANLAANARDAMPSGGRLTIATRNQRIDAALAGSRSDITPGDYVMIDIADTGTGMTAEVIAQIFEPFFTTKGAGKGTGLGLSMVFGFMKQSGGHITVHSEEGAGTTVRLYLPRAAHAAIEPAPDAPDTAVRSGADATVLVVEDNDTLRRVVLRQVTELGYRVVAARDSAEALTQLERGGIDLLFTDIVMPGEMDGFELTRHVRRHWPGVRVVHTSGFPDARVPTDAVRAQMARILLKPYRKEDLARTLHDALHTPVEAMEDHAV